MSQSRFQQVTVISCRHPPILTLVFIISISLLPIVPPCQAWLLNLTCLLDPDWGQWKIWLLSWTSSGLAGERELSQEECWPLLLYDPGAGGWYVDDHHRWLYCRWQWYMTMNEWSMSSFKQAASSHVKRLVGERGDWEVEVERLRSLVSPY